MGKRLKPEENIAKLREVDVRLARGETPAQAARSIGVTEQTYARLRPKSSPRVRPGGGQFRSEESS